MATCTVSHLQSLLNASSKDVVVRICNEAFLYRDRRHFPDTVEKSVSQALQIQTNEAKQLLLALGTLLKSAVFQGSKDPHDLVRLFPDDFHKNLRDLLCKTVLENLAKWREQAINNQVSLPRLVDFDWRVDIKTASDSVARMSVPTCILQLQIQHSPSKVGIVPDMSDVNVELSKETLDTMLDGLTKIRDQLSSVAKR
ncbi:hypothetical protein CHS0354_013842 [Potamilus streckersoni]|uniref:COMM domain-containing protein n=1 Tax=Potamilus streckersoni TaxID=2493646 RepID=A0AAE0SIA0_9BIVA|nr:hypothetical protein CHS0354_013842 [Potamilus streckersoni]